MAAPALTPTASGIAYPDRAAGAGHSSIHQRPLGRWADRAAAAEGERIARTLAIAGLIVSMALGSVAIWTVIPVAGLWLVSQLSDSYVRLPMGPTLLAAVGIPVAMALGVTALSRLERTYMRLTGKPARVRVVPTWRRSIGELPSRPPASVLEKLMVANVLVALSCLVVWFFVFAGSSLPA